MREAHLDAEGLRDALTPAAAVEALRQALRDGLDPAADPPRQVLDLTSGAGQLLSMPSATSDAVGVKLVTVGPDNPQHGRPLVQGVFVLFDPDTLAPIATMDGAALTTLRTPAVSVAAVLPVLQARGRAQHTVVFGAGPQGVGHVTTLRDCGIELDEVTYVVRHPDRVDGSALEEARVTTPDQCAGTVAQADIIVCATSASEPVFDSASVRPDVVVMAMGAHQRHTREVDSALMARAQVIVEDARHALAESGNVVLAIDEGRLAAEELVPMYALATGSGDYARDRPIVFSGSGMSWEDLVVARAAFAAGGGGAPVR